MKEALREASGGKWLAWLNYELKRLSPSTAGNYMRDARFCDKYGFANFANLPSVSALHELSRKQTTPEQVATALAELAEGPVTPQRMSTILKKEKPEEKPVPPLPPSNKFAMTQAELEDRRTEVVKWLMENGSLFKGLVDDEKERGLRITIHATGCASIDLLNITNRQAVWKEAPKAPPPPPAPPLPSPPFFDRGGGVPLSPA